jgi:hypothetical protein
MAIAFRGFAAERPGDFEGYVVIQESGTYTCKTADGAEHTVRAISAPCKSVRELNWWIDEAIANLERAREEGKRFFMREDQRS